MERIAGCTGFASNTSKLNAFDAIPPGLVTTTEKTPAFARSDVFRVTVNRPASEGVVIDRGEPLSVTVGLGRKYAPRTVRTGKFAPTTAEEGFRLVTLG